MKNPIYYSDIRILIQLFVPNLHKVTLNDSLQRVHFNENATTQPQTQDTHAVLLCTQPLPAIEAENYNTIIDFGNNRLPDSWRKRTFHYINNPDGTMRWLFQENDLGSVTDFYASLNRRSRIRMALLKTLQFFRLGKIYSHGKLTIYSKDELKADSLLKTIPHTHYGLFMGTYGAERTVVLSLRNGNTTTHFAKIALSRFTANRINEERRALSRLSFLNLTKTVVPQEYFLNIPEIMVASNVRTEKSRRTLEFTDIHAEALVELHDKTRLWQTIHETLFWNHILTNIHEIGTTTTPKIMNRVQQLLRILKTEIAYDAEILTQTAFGDFTPWNHYTENNRLNVYDLECAQAQAPFLYDLFHFHFQKGIIIDQHNFKKIWQECLKSCSLPAIRTIIDRYDLNLAFYLKLYIMRIASEQAVIMQQQTQLSDNQMRQLNVWEQALRYVIDSEAVSSNREAFIHDFREALVEHAHAFIKFEAHSLTALKDSSDLDIAIEQSSVSALLSFIDHHSYVYKTIIREKSYMTTVTCFFKDQGHLSIDLVHRFKRRNLEFMNIRHFLRSSYLNEAGVRVPDLRFDMEYAFCFYYMNHAPVPQKYRDFFSAFPASDKSRAIAYLTNKYNLPFNDWNSLFENRETFVKNIRKTLHTIQLKNKGRWIQNTLSYTRDLLNDLFSNRSITITLSGVDGVGKTTVIQELTQQIQTHLRKEVVLLRHRPGILPILSSVKHGSAKKAEAVAAVTKPGTGTNYSKFSSLLRFSYYLADYIIGQTIVFLKYKIRGKVVVYDRYYFDFINHPERSNIRLPKRFSKWFYRFIAKPDLNILLVAHSEEILKRKQELDAATIEHLSSGYRELFEEFRHKYPQSQYCTIHNHTLERTRMQIIDVLQKVA